MNKKIVLTLSFFAVGVVFGAEKKSCSALAAVAASGSKTVSKKAGCDCADRVTASWSKEIQGFEFYFKQREASTLVSDKWENIKCIYLSSFPPKDQEIDAQSKQKLERIRLWMRLTLQQCSDPVIKSYPDRVDKERARLRLV